MNKTAMDNIEQPGECYDNMPKDDSSIEILSECGKSEWSIYSAGRSSIAGSEGSSMDFQKLSIHSKMATIVHHDGRQFIERRDLNDDDGGLPYLAEFYLGDEVWKLSDCFLISPRRYIAKVCAEGTLDLEGAVDFEEALRMLLKHLKVETVLLDEQLDECNKAKTDLQMTLGKLKDSLSANIDHKRDVIELRMLLKKHGNPSDMNYKHDLIKCSRLSSETMSALDNYFTRTLKLIQRNEFLGQLDDSSLSFEFINDAIQEALNVQRAQLAAICPLAMQHKIEELPDDQVPYVSMDDMHLFSDLAKLDQAMFEAAIPLIVSKFLARVREINDEQIADLSPLSNRIFLYVCKSLYEVAEQLRAHTKTNSVIIYSEERGWQVINVQEESLDLKSKCLKQQLQMLARIANHFEPGGPFRTIHFPYKFKLFRNMDAIPEPVRIWLCLLDNCMKNVVKADADKMQMLSCFFKSYVSFIASGELPGETLECLRTITHDALRSLDGMRSSFQPKRTTSGSVLLKCTDTISRSLDKFPRQHFGNDCDQIEATLRRVFKQDISVDSTAFCDAFKQLREDISDLPLEWFVQLPPSENRNLLLQGQFIVPVDSVWKDTEYQSFKVVDHEAFVKTYKLLYSCEEIPKHYQLKGIQVLLDKLATKLSLNRGKHTADMVNSARNSILYLKEQPEYSCFELFLKRMGESFSHTNEEKQSLVDLRNEMSPINESEASDLPRTDVSDSAETPEALPELFDGSISKGRLTNCFGKYSTQFDMFITKVGRLPREKRIEQIVSEVALRVQPQLATTWTEEFKQNELPGVLAGLSAVWSLIVSKNDNSSEKLVKPSNLQISCVLSFFGDQNLNDVDLYRLVDVSTQQGKELVVGLTAALLALYGHKVLIACYNSNLARRNSTHLIELFKSFSVHSNISFGSIEDMARERSREVYDKYAAYIYKCLGVAHPLPKHVSDDQRSVLLIDDIDILLQSKTLGQAFERFVRPTIPGLALVQEKMLSIVDHYAMQSLNSFIMHSNHPQMYSLRAFMNKPQSYTLFEGIHFLSKEYLNQSLINKYLLKYMNMRSKDEDNHNLRLSSNGVMVIKDYDKHDQQESCFQYLKLKGSDFQQTVDGYKNYGYLTLGSIPFPYAHLLKSFPLVFAFASAPLDGYEEITLRDHYGIHHNIAKQHPLRIVSTEFDSKKHFRCVDAYYEWDWMISIMVATNAAIARNCSVLIFFKSEVEMDNFQSKFALHLKHLQVTAIKTASNGENLSTDEIAVDEVAVLVIEKDDRNGHFAEDRQVHVIQTFWSSDSKEEDLIRRQAERSHGGGSYELILFKKHLSIPGENKKDTMSYDLLETLREPRAFGIAMNSLTHYAEKYKFFEQICKTF